MKCPQCGTELPDSASFCPECGLSLKQQAPAQQQVDPQPAEPTQPAPQQPVPPEHTAAPPEASAPSAPAAEPAPSTPEGGKKNNRVVAILGVVVGVLLIISGVVKIASGMGLFKKEPEAPAPKEITKTDKKDEKEPEPTPEPEPEPEPDPKEKRELDESLCLDKNDFITLYACAELDGAGLYKVISDVDCDLIMSDEDGFFSTDAKSYALFVRVGDKTLDFDGVKALKSSDGPWYQILCNKYATVAEALKGIGNLEFDEFKEGTSGISCGIVSNIAGERFVFAGYLTDNDVVNLQLYTEQSIKGGSLSNFGYTVDDAYKAIAEFADEDDVDTGKSSDGGKGIEGAEEINLDELTESEDSSK